MLKEKLYLITWLNEEERLLSIVFEYRSELLTALKADGISLLESLILDDNVEVIKEFESAGFSPEAKIIRNLNAVQLALELLSPKLFDYFVGKYGNEKITSMLLEIYGSREELFRAILISFSSRIKDKHIQ